MLSERLKNLTINVDMYLDYDFLYYWQSDEDLGEYYEGLDEFESLTDGDVKEWERLDQARIDIAVGRMKYKDVDDDVKEYIAIYYGDCEW